MEMNDKWASELAELGIIFKDYPDKIIFYDPKEHPDHVVIREHIKFNHRHSESGLTHRVGKMSFIEFEKMLK